MKKSLVVALLLLLNACFGKVAVVPAAQAPKLVDGDGFHCFELISPIRHALPPRSIHKTYCERTAESCTRKADNYRRQPNVEGVSTCGSRDSAYCSATFTNESDASWACFAAIEDCQGQVGGVAGVAGTKQSECTEYR